MGACAPVRCRGLRSTAASCYDKGMWRTILYPTDFSETAENAFPHALTLAVLLNARLVLLHVRVLMQDDPDNPRFHFPQMEEIYREAEEIARGILDLRKGSTPHPEVTTRIRRGLTADDVILLSAQEEQAELIVMGTHGRRGLDLALLGSTVQAVAKKASIPVCTVRKDVPSPDPELPYRRILVPVDFSPGSARALKTAAGLAKATGGTLLILHVLNDGDAKEAGHRLKALAAPLSLPGAETLVLEGTPEEIILQEARRMPADAIVMSKKGRSFLEYVLLGSVTERTIHMAPCPVISLPV